MSIIIWIILSVVKINKYYHCNNTLNWLKIMIYYVFYWRQINMITYEIQYLQVYRYLQKYSISEHYGTVIMKE